MDVRREAVSGWRPPWRLFEVAGARKFAHAAGVAADLSWPASTTRPSRLTTEAPLLQAARRHQWKRQIPGAACGSPDETGDELPIIPRRPRKVPPARTRSLAVLSGSAGRSGWRPRCGGLPSAPSPALRGAWRASSGARRRIAKACSGLAVPPPQRRRVRDPGSLAEDHRPLQRPRSSGSTAIEMPRRPVVRGRGRRRTIVPR